MKTQSELISTIVRAMLPHYRHTDNPLSRVTVDMITIDLEDKDIAFLEALAAVAEIAIARQPAKYPEIVFAEDDAA
jgi:hypothetical protein